MKVFINQSKRVYYIGNKVIEPNSYFTLSDDEYEKIKDFKEIKPLFIDNSDKKEIEKEKTTELEEEAIKTRDVKLNFNKNKIKRKK